MHVGTQTKSQRADSVLYWICMKNLCTRRGEEGQGGRGGGGRGVAPNSFAHTLFLMTYGSVHVNKYLQIVICLNATLLDLQHFPPSTATNICKMVSGSNFPIVHGYNKSMVLRTSQPFTATNKCKLSGLGTNLADHGNKEMPKHACTMFILLRYTY